MVSKHRMAEVAALLGDPSRAGMANALLDVTARPASELARIVGVTPATASAHLAKLVAGGLLRVEPRGRHRYYRLAGPEVAQALEALATLVPPRAPAVDDDPLRRARICYDHLAGRLGVAVTEALVAQKLLLWRDDAFSLPAAGRRWFERFGIAIAPLEQSRRPLLKSCTDFSERREHLAGALGAALASDLLERDWLRRERGKRSLIVTAAGRAGLRRALGLRVD